MPYECLLALLSIFVCLSHARERFDFTLQHRNLDHGVLIPILWQLSFRPFSVWRNWKCINLVPCRPWTISHTLPFPTFSVCCNEPIQKQTLPNYGVETWTRTSWYRMSPPSCPWTRQFYRTENLHPVGQTATVSAQRLHKTHTSHKRWIINTENVSLSRQNTQSESYKTVALWCNFYLIPSFWMKASRRAWKSISLHKNARQHNLFILE